MKKRLLGTLTVSEVGMGCMGFSHGYGVPPEESYAVEAIRKAFDFGCTLFDTAETYGREQFYPGHNEELVGKAIAPFRKEAVLATKLHLGPKEERAGKSTYQVVKEHLAQSMKRLQTDYIDLYYLHRLSEDVPVEEVAEAMGRLIQEGLGAVPGLGGDAGQGPQGDTGLRGAEPLQHGGAGLRGGHLPLLPGAPHRGGALLPHCQRAAFRENHRSDQV